MRPVKRIRRKNENHTNVDSDLDKNINKIKNDLGNSSDLSIHISKTRILKYAIIFIKNTIDKIFLNNIAQEISFLLKSNNEDARIFFDVLKNSFLCGMETIDGDDFESLYDRLLAGNVIILLDNCKEYIAVNVNQFVGRQIDEPTSQTIIRGPKEAFTEKIALNIALIRKRIKNKNLRVENLILGNETKTTVTIAYVENIAKNEVVEEIKRRLNEIDCDAVFEGGNIEELIKDDPYSIFPEFLDSEKPDTVSACLLEGRVAILTDGTPYVLTAPAVFIEFLQSSEDYYHHFGIASFVRIIRYIAFFLTLFTPALFIALTAYHQEMIPTPLLTSIAAQHEGVPFTTFVETLFMEIIFEILREAGIRMPRVIGPAISIVGALVLGQAAVEAGIISPAIVIVVSLTAICSFAISNYSMANATRITRFLFMFISAVFGLYGIFYGLIILVLHLCKLKSIGFPYMTSASIIVREQNTDRVMRAPIWKMRYPPIFSQKAKIPRNMEKPVESNMKKDQEYR